MSGGAADCWSKHRSREPHPSRTPAFARALLSVFLLMQSGAIVCEGSSRTLTSISELKGLQPEQARQRCPVHIKAVVTYFDQYSPDLFVQDQTAGIWVVWDNSKPRPSLGELLEMTGYSAQADFAPEIVRPEWKVIGHAALPEPEKLNYRDLVTTSKDSTWVEAEGVVRQISYMPLVPNRRSLWMSIALTGSVGHLDLQVPWDGSPLPSKYVDARIRVLGVCGAEFNASHQQIGGVVYSPGLEFITVLEPAPRDQFAQQTDLIGRLQTFGYQRPFEHRVKVAGTVTAVTRNNGMFIQDSSGGIYVETSQWDEVVPGDRIETLGFLKVYQSHLRLENAIVRKLAGTQRLTPTQITVERELAGKLDSTLVAITGTVIGHSNVGAMSALLVEQTGVTFPVVVGEHSPAISLPLGTIIRAVGVSSDEWDFFGRVTAFKILTRSPEDVVIVRKAPWWSIWYLVISFAVLGTITLLISVWVIVLRRRVQAQTKLISQKLAQEEMLREEAQLANKARGEFLANMSHEIRTPMNGVLGMTQAALETNLSKEQREYLEIAKSSADSLLTVVNDILDFSKIEAGKLDLDPVPLDVRDCLSSILKPLAFRAGEKNLEFLCSIAPDVPRKIVADSARLSQIITNLVGNAIKFTESGEVEVQVMTESCDADSAGLHFCVRDTGIGIPEERHRAIFEAFSQADSSTTRRFGGTGLGLTISSRLVELMRGRLWVESQLGVGSQFHFSMQVAAYADGEEAVKPAAAAELADLSMLIVDDNARSRAILRDLAAAHCVEAVTAASGEEALEALRAAPWDRSRFNLIVLDDRMPGMDGLAVVEELRRDERFARIPVVMLCSPGHHEHPGRRRSAEIQTYLSKPVFPTQFLEGVRSALGMSPGKQSPVPRGRQDSPQDTRAPLRVLLAEDNAVNQKVASRLLEKLGHSVTVVRDGIEALHVSGAGSFDVILMDVQMPGMDGLEATAAIRQREKSSGIRLPIIALTAHAMTGDRERCLAAGMDGYVTKPIRTEEIIREIIRLQALAVQN